MFLSFELLSTKCFHILFLRRHSGADGQTGESPRSYLVQEWCGPTDQPFVRLRSDGRSRNGEIGTSLADGARATAMRN